MHVNITPHPRSSINTSSFNLRRGLCGRQRPLAAAAVSAVPNQDPQFSVKHGRLYGEEVNTEKPDGYFSKMLNTSTQLFSSSKLEGRPQCTQLGFGGSMAGSWYKDDRSGNLMYELEACRLRRLGAAATRACLAGQRIVFLGDSVMRYQFTSLVHFLASGAYQNPYDDGLHSVSNVDHWKHDYLRMYRGKLQPSMIEVQRSTSSMDLSFHAGWAE
mmetsp:Transcript_5297/g.16036  ORF Transcript_5297/g.16036 Transcript_5297/m.16036 type:complete len:215 (+) Transcript_5297:2769-3413(+)